MSEKQKTVTVTLDCPIEFDGRPVTSLTFRRMKARDALGGEGETNPVRAGYKLFATLAGVDVKLIEELDVDDLEKIGEAIVPLMGKSAMEAYEEEKAKKAAEKARQKAMYAAA